MILQILRLYFNRFFVNYLIVVDSNPYSLAEYSHNRSKKGSEKIKKSILIILTDDIH